MAAQRGYCTVWTESHTKPFVKPWVGKTQQSLVLHNPPEPDMSSGCWDPLSPTPEVDVRLHLGQQHPCTNKEVDKSEKAEEEKDSTSDDNHEETPT